MSGLAGFPAASRSRFTPSMSKGVKAISLALSHLERPEPAVSVIFSGSEGSHACARSANEVTAPGSTYPRSRSIGSHAVVFADGRCGHCAHGLAQHVHGVASSGARVDDPVHRVLKRGMDIGGTLLHDALV